MDFFLDTCVINRILDGHVNNWWSMRGLSFVTDTQLQELLDTRNEARREYLFRGLLALRLNVIRPSEMRQLFDCGQNFDTGERFTWACQMYGTAAASRSRSVTTFQGSPPS
jgi:hypothetical protein